MDSVTVDGVDSGLAGRKAILDTGTTLILAPAADAAKVHQGIQGAKSDGQGGFLVPCTTNASIALNFGGKSFAIDLRDLAFAPVDANNSTGDCVSAISGGNVGDATEWLVCYLTFISVSFANEPCFCRLAIRSSRTHTSRRMSTRIKCRLPNWSDNIFCSSVY